MKTKRVGYVTHAQLMQYLNILVDEIGEEIVVPFKQRLSALEARTYRGVWKMRTPYARGSFVTCSGCMWHSNEDENLDKPGASDAWTLVVKRGRDGSRPRPVQGSES